MTMTIPTNGFSSPLTDIPNSTHNLPPQGAESKALQKANGSALCHTSLQVKAQTKEKSPKKGKKEYSKRRMVKILVFEIVFSCEELV